MKIIKLIKENKNVKYSLFFGFYAIFFLTIYLVIIPMYGNKTINNEQEKEINIYEIVSAFKDKKYLYKVTINENNNISILNNNEEFENNKYNYFFNPYNLNQLIKNSKYENKNDNSYIFSLGNSYLSELFNTEYIDGTNEILLYVNNNKLEKTVYNLSSFYNMEKLEIEIKYMEEV